MQQASLKQVQSCVCLDRRSEQGTASPLKDLMLPRKPVSHDSYECETPHLGKMWALVGFVMEEGLSFVILRKKIPLKAK